MLNRTCHNCKHLYTNEQHQHYCRRFPPTVMIPEWVKLSEQSVVPKIISGILPPVPTTAVCGEHSFNLKALWGGVK